MKAVLISINKPHTDNINSGVKKVELRTRAPKLQPPFKVYTYETLKNGGCGKVINEWICESIITIPYNENGYGLFMESGVCARACINSKELYHYLQGKTPYLWSISDLIVYDKPKELYDFYKPCIDEEMEYCPCCKYGCEIFSSDEVECSADLPGSSFEQICLNRVKRAPQSWCYVRELKAVQ